MGVRKGEITRVGVWALGALAVVVLLGLLSEPAGAQRRASAAESRGMWRAVEREPYTDGCVHHRGLISTAYSPRRKYGTVFISDRFCGNGQAVLAKRRGARRGWRILGSGSDWGYPGRCAADLRRIPRRVLEDFFGDDFCEGYGSRRSRAAGGGRPQLLCVDVDAHRVFPARRPRRCVIDTVLGPTRIDLRQMRWGRWGQRKAVGRGALYLLEEGQPTVGGESGYRGAVSVRLSGRAPSAPAAAPCYRGRWFGRAVLRVRSGPDQGRRIEQRLTGGCLA